MDETELQPQIMAINERLHLIREEIATAARRSGRSADAVRLVAVTKTQPARVLRAASLAGITEFGENYLQEADAKFRELAWPHAGAGQALVRHAIGHIQSNKAHLALRWFEIIETVDSLRLAQRLDQLAAALEYTPTVLLQVNISKDFEKYGFSVEELEGILTCLANLTHIRVKGLMTIGRLVPEPEAARADFAALRELRDRLRAVAPPAVCLDELSMGMSHDFAVAIEEGATIVRVGSRLFGPRT